MRIGCLQFAPAVGDVDNNLNRADAILNRADPQELDLLVLPELAFSGYNFRSLQEITPFLEPSGSGITSLWARTQALKHDCTVIVGYPEKVDLAERWPANPEYYNSAIVVSYEGDTVANYRKTHLYYTDETWALENPKGFFGKPLPGLGRVSIGICMDLNPYKFQTPWETFEFANHVVNSRTRLVVVSMAWITQENPRLFSQEPQEADMNTLTYWISRLEPIIRAEWDEEVIVVFANRTGSEDEVTYAGTSAVVGIKSGEVWVYGILGRGDKELLVVDTDAPPFAKLVYRPDGDTLEVENESPLDLTHHRLSLPSGPNSPEQDFRRHLDSYTNDGPDLRAPEPSPRQEQTRKAASYHRDDLSISVSQKRQPENRQETFSVHTPSAPSPTPQHIRPRLPTQLAEPATHQYFDSDSFNSSRGATFFSENNQPPDANTDLTAHQIGLHRNVSPSNSSEGYLSEGVTSGNFGMAHGHHGPREIDGPWMLGHEDDHERHGGAENRHSLRSDVSVWNNQHGRPRTMATLPTPPHEPTLKKALPAREKTSQSKTSRRSRSRQPDSETSRHESKYSNPTRAKTTRPAASELKAGLSLLNEMAPRADSAQEPLLRFLEDRSDDPAGKFSARDGKSAKSSLPRMDANTVHSHHERALSGNSIPVAMDPSIWRNLAFPASALPSERQPSERKLSEQQSSKRQSSKRRPSERRSSDQVQNENPILRPASRSRIGKRDASNQRRDAEQALPSDPNVNRDRSGTGTQSNHESRAVSRGRPRSPKESESQQMQSQPGREPRTNSRRSRKPSQSEIDLSQFRLIEDYPSRNCPLHGSRSRSRARHGHSSSRQRTPATGQTQAPPSRQGTSSRPPVQNTPVSAVPKALYGEKVASRSTTDLSKPAKPAEQAALRVKHESSDSVDTMTSSSSTLSPGQDEPKTPVAMVLLPELEDAQRMAATNRFLPPLKSVERGHGRSNLRRPRSAIW